MTIRALVVDDEPLARRRLRRLLGDHPDVEVVGEADSGDAAVRAVLQLRPTVVFLDINMPGSDGMAALRAIRAALPDELRPHAVFTTAHDEHAVEAFELEGTDYLLKPIERQDLARALRRVRKAVWVEPLPVTPPAAAMAPLTPAPQPSKPAAPAPDAPDAPEHLAEHLAGHRAGRLVPIPLHDVACVVVDDTITFAVHPGGRHRLKTSIQETEGLLPSPPFVRISRAAILNLDWVDHLDPGPSGTYTVHLRAGVDHPLSISRRRARRVRDLLNL
jgi:DNA-binding LytR/AlgR family response regulator